MGNQLAPTPADSLRPDERKQLLRCEGIIARGQQAFFEVAEAFRVILEGRLYRETYRSFKEYCEDRWGFGKNRGHCLANAGRLLLKLRAEGKELPQNERQARSILKGPAPAPEQIRWCQRRAEVIERRIAALSELHAPHPQARRLDEIVISYLEVLNNPCRPGADVRTFERVRC